MSDCKDYRVGSRKWQICTGEADLPEQTINAYRASWGLKPLTEFPPVKRKALVFSGAQNKEKPPADTSQIASCLSCGSSVVRQDGPGTKLKKIFEAKGVPNCSNCNRLAESMDQWGVEGCLRNYDYIVEDIFPRAKAWFKTNKPWAHSLLPGVIEDVGIRIAIKSYLDSVLKSPDAGIEPTQPHNR